VRSFLNAGFIGYNKQRRAMKQVLNQRAPHSDEAKTRDLLLAAKIAGMELPAEIVADTRYATQIDHTGTPTQINWKQFMAKEMPRPTLKGPGGFGELPPLKKNSRRPSVESNPPAPAPEVVTAAEPPTPRASDKETAYWFGILVSKMKDRFTEVRRAFRILDDDMNGFLSRAEFKGVLKMFNLDIIPDAVFERILQLIDKNGDGTITFAEFGKLVDMPNALEAFKAQSY